MPIPVLTTLFDGNTIYVAPLNNNFGTLRNYLNTYAAFKDAAATITGAWTFSTAPVINAPLSLAGLTVTTSGVVVQYGGVTVQQGGVNATGNVDVTGLIEATGQITGRNLVSIGTLTVTGVANLSSSLSVASTITTPGQISAGSYVGNGALITGLAAANLTPGGTLPALNGAALTNLDAGSLATGTVSPGRLPTSYTALQIGALNGTTITYTGAASFAGLTVGSTPSFRPGGAADTVPAFVAGASDECISLTPGTGVTRYLRFADGFGNQYKIEARVI